MGTRSLINYNGKKYIYTHWDGSPSDLGVELNNLRTHTKDAVKRVALEHTIDYNFEIGMWYQDNKPSKKGKHDDWIDYEYDVRPNGVYVRNGGYSTSEASSKKHKWLKL